MAARAPEENARLELLGRLRGRLDESIGETLREVSEAKRKYRIKMLVDSGVVEEMEAVRRQEIRAKSTLVVDEEAGRAMLVWGKFTINQRGEIDFKHSLFQKYGEIDCRYVVVQVDPERKSLVFNPGSELELSVGEVEIRNDRFQVADALAQAYLTPLTRLTSEPASWEESMPGGR